MLSPNCCDAPALEADARYRPVWGPSPERVMVCRRCHALWREALVSRMGFGDRPDREWDEYTRLSEQDAERNFGQVR